MDGQNSIIRHTSDMSAHSASCRHAVWSAPPHSRMGINFEVVTTDEELWAFEIEIGDKRITVPFRDILHTIRFAVAMRLIVSVYRSGLELFRRQVFFRPLATKSLYIVAVCCIIWPRARPIFIVPPAFWLLLFLAEIIVDQVHAFVHWFCAPPRIGHRQPGSRWELVASLKSSNNGYHSGQTYGASVCDFNSLDDPMWPYASAIYYVEIRRRCLIWRKVSIWKVSLLSGSQKKIHEFQQLCEWTDANPFGRRFVLYSTFIRRFQSKRVTFTAIRYANESKLYIYDCRYGKHATYAFDRAQAPKFTVVISCLGRIFSNDGALKGWRIRWIGVHVEYNAHQRLR